MSDVRGELVFLTGPQAGQRVVLRSNVMVAGRSASADVGLDEEYASREHMRFRLTASGWLMENLSGGGTLVNGKRIKSQNKKVLLETGDVLGVGIQTRILFVSPGDDVDQAVLAWQRKHPLPEVQPDRASELDHPPGDRQAPAVAARAERAEKPTEPLRAGPRGPAGQAARSSKLVKYAAFGLVYAAALVGLIVFLARAGNSGKGPAGESGGPLTDGQIAEALSALPRGASPMPARASAELTQALSLYANLPSKPGDLYRCVRSFQLHLAYKNGPAFEDVRHELKYQDALNRLIDLVRGDYRNAWAAEQAGKWPQSASAWDQLKAELPETDQTGPVFGTLVRNIDQHLTYVRGHVPAARRR